MGLSIYERLGSQTIVEFPEWESSTPRWRSVATESRMAAMLSLLGEDLEMSVPSGPIE